jgi:hypothetical protein
MNKINWLLLIALLFVHTYGMFFGMVAFNLYGYLGVLIGALEVIGLVLITILVLNCKIAQEMK